MRGTGIVLAAALVVGGCAPTVRSAAILAADPSIDSQFARTARERVEAIRAEHDDILTRWPTGAELRVWAADPERREFVLAAFREWMTVGLPLHAEAAEDESDANVVVTFVQRDASGQGALGFTHIRYTRSGIRSAEIQLMVRDGGGEPLPLNAQWTAALHEAGHALGLVHTGDRMSIMHPWSHRPAVSGCDVATIRRLYGVR